MSIYAVNGKVPVAAWIPSRDTAGNGTTTLNDLVGTNHGTLTNMDAATDWVADASNGGVRALDFDGVNDVVNCGTITSLNGATKASYSSWVFKATAGSTVGFGGAAGGPGGGNRFSCIWFTDGNLYVACEGSTLTAAFATVALSGNGWKHIVVSYDGELTGNANRLKVWIDGVSQSPTYVGTIPSNLGSVTPQYSFGKDSSNRFCGGRIDDVRLFTTIALNASDVAYLYNSGNGRGRIANNLSFQLGQPI